MTTPAPDRETALVREIEHEADAALAAIPDHLRVKHRPVPAGSARLVFSHRSARPGTPETRKA